MQRLPNETLAEYYARLKLLNNGSILGTQGMMDQPVTPPTVQSTQITQAPLGQVVVQGSDSDSNYMPPKSMTPEEIIARQVGRVTGAETGYGKTGLGAMGALGGLFGLGAEAYERQAAEYQLGKKLMGDDFKGLDDRSAAIDLGASYFDDPAKLEGLLMSGGVPGIAQSQAEELYAPQPTSQPSIVGGLFSNFLGGALDFLGVTRKPDEPKAPVYTGIAEMQAAESGSGGGDYTYTNPTTGLESYSAPDLPSDTSGLGASSVGSDSYQQF